MGLSSQSVRAMDACIEAALASPYVASHPAHARGTLLHTARALMVAKTTRIGAPEFDMASRLLREHLDSQAGSHSFAKVLIETDSSVLSDCQDPQVLHRRIADLLAICVAVAP